MSTLPLAGPATLGSMLLPEPVLVMLITGDAVKNLQTPTMVAFTVTDTLSLAWAFEATMAVPTPRSAARASDCDSFESRNVFMNPLLRFIPRLKQTCFQ